MASSSKKSLANSKGSKKKTSGSDSFYDERDYYDTFGSVYPETLKAYKKGLPDLIEKSKKVQSEQKNVKSKSVATKSRKPIEQLKKGEKESNLVFSPHDWQNAEGIDLSNLLGDKRRSNDSKAAATISKKTQNSKSKKSEVETDILVSTQKGSRNSRSTVQSSSKRNQKQRESERSSSPLIFYDDYIDDVLTANNIFYSLEEPKKRSPKKVEETQRSLRSSRKYKDLSPDDKRLSDFSIYSIDWYQSKEKSYKAKLYTVLSDFKLDKPCRREGNEKLSYNYLLLDLPEYSSRNIDWNSYIDAIFYIGKGKNNRAYDHTREAEAYLVSGKHSSSKKINKILGIWNNNSPVRILKISENIMAEEAYTREAFMIDAIGKRRLCNVQDGTYYGVASTMTVREKREMGTVLLVEALNTLYRRGADSVYPRNSIKNGNSVKNGEKKTLDFLLVSPGINRELKYNIDGYL